MQQQNGGVPDSHGTQQHDSHCKRWQRHQRPHSSNEHSHQKRPLQGIAIQDGDCAQEPRYTETVLVTTLV